MGTVLDVNIRSLNPKFMVLPFQAVECFIPDMQCTPDYLACPQRARSVGWSAIVTGYVHALV